MKNDLPFEHYYSRKEVARRVGVCTETIKRAERRGDLVGIKINLRLTRYAKSEVTRWLDSGRGQR